MSYEYECPICKISASDEAWDEEAESFYGDNITPINKAFRNKNIEEEVCFACPHCLTWDIFISDIKRVRV
jgi:hypothetical protein